MRRIEAVLLPGVLGPCHQHEPLAAGDFEDLFPRHFRAGHDVKNLIFACLLEVQRQVCRGAIVELESAKRLHLSPHRKVLGVGSAEMDHAATGVGCQECIIEGSDKVPIERRRKKLCGATADLAETRRLGALEAYDRLKLLDGKMLEIPAMHLNERLVDGGQVASRFFWACVKRFEQIAAIEIDAHIQRRGDRGKPKEREPDLGIQKGLSSSPSELPSGAGIEVWRPELAEGGGQFMHLPRPVEFENIGPEHAIDKMDAEEAGLDAQGAKYGGVQDVGGLQTELAEGLVDPLFGLAIHIAVSPGAGAPHAKGLFCRGAVEEQLERRETVLACGDQRRIIERG